ncbi:WhiB family transcriptional regulator [Nonomuraea sp. NPDC059023]|uniref:WhiB family transcriptional regulator n=1 Tax=unclassified Nonomuraea TaxID=2593643 RepID=UPI0036960E2F
MRSNAACRGTDPDLFFPLTHEGPGAAQTDQAKAICRGCPCLDSCLADVIANPPAFGVFACTTPDERRILRAKRGLADVR